MADLNPDDALEVEADRRRRVTGAFRLGSESSPRTTGPSSAAQLAAGLGIALTIALVVGVIAIVHH
jgi:hypothetical protein